MDYAVHTMPSYQHMQGKAAPAHMGSKNSEPHKGTGTSYHIGAGKATKNPIDDDR